MPQNKRKKLYWNLSQVSLPKHRSCILINHYKNGEDIETTGTQIIPEAQTTAGTGRTESSAVCVPA